MWHQSPQGNINVKFKNSGMEKLKYGAKNGTPKTLLLLTSMFMVGTPRFPHSFCWPKHK